MKPKSAALSFLMLASFATDAVPATPAAKKVRKFHFTYQVVVKDIPRGAKLVRLWIPLAASDANQTVVLEKVTSPVRVRQTREPVYGNRMLYAELASFKGNSAQFLLDCDVTRKEYSKGDYESLMKYNRDPEPAPASLARFLRPDALVPVGGKMKQLAEENTRGRSGPVEKARALYDYVFHTMRYDKSGEGWGRGDSLWACDAKRGNCTDFHSVFISLMRAENIPARFEIGFPIPADASQGEISGYHCWAEFYLDGPGWVPVDISEAWKNPSHHHYFFGTLDANRVQVSVGRDINLSPRQAGPPLNYLVYPYMEVDGKPLGTLEKKFSFREERAPRLVASEGSG